MIISAADLFCGAGGTSTGLYAAVKHLGYDLKLLAINHWDVAISTHSANYPLAEHRCESLDSVDPRKVVPSGHLDLLVASPECTHHSKARGGKPISDQSRASAWHILRWAEALYIENILVENVPEFMDWGPIGKDHLPMQSLKGKTFLAFVESLKSLGYNVDWRVINTADYGDPTTRKRLFIMARRGKQVVWPVATFSKTGGTDMLRTTKKWKPARDIIDWSVKGESIFTRKKPLSENTMKRINAGLRKFSGFPFVIGQQSSAAPRSVDDPIPTIAGAGAISFIEPFLVVMNGTKDSQIPSTARSVEDPAPVITGQNHVGLVEPFLVSLNGTQESHINNSTAKSLDEPIPALTGTLHMGLVEPFLVQYHGSSYEGGERVRSVDQPLPTIGTNNQFALAEPFLVKYYGSGEGAESIDDPLSTVTGKDRFGLVVPTSEGQAIMDIRFRMLQPHELAKAMSFPDGYQFSGNREQRVKQIGNAVPVRTAQALCESLIG